MCRAGLFALGVCGAGFSLMRAVAFGRTKASGATGGFSVRKEGKRICVIPSVSIFGTKGYGKPWLRTKKQKSRGRLMRLMMRPRSVLLRKRNIKRTSCCINTKASAIRYLPAFACIFVIHFFIKKREGALRRYSEPSQRLPEEGKDDDRICQEYSSSHTRRCFGEFMLLVKSYRNLKQLGFLV